MCLNAENVLNLLSSDSHNGLGPHFHRFVVSCVCLITQNMNTATFLSFVQILYNTFNIKYTFKNVVTYSF